MTKTLIKAIMIRPRLKNRFNNTKSDENGTLYKIKWKFCTKLLRKTKKILFFKGKPKLASDDKYFWQTIKPYFSGKGNFSSKIMISQKDLIVSDDRRLSGIFDTYFINITKTLDLEPKIISTNKNVPKIVETFKDHLSIKKFFSLRREGYQFSFYSLSENEVRKVILNIDGKMQT